MKDSNKVLRIVLGRFQPFHFGHKSFVDAAIKDCNEGDKVLIMIGSSNSSLTLKNPLTYEERKLILTNIYKDEPKILIKGIPDFHDEDKWKEKFHEIINETISEAYKEGNVSSVMYSGSKDDDATLRSSWSNGIPVKSIVSHNIEGTEEPLSGTHIRDLFNRKEYELLKKYCPPETIDVFIKTD